MFLSSLATAKKTKKQHRSRHNRWAADPRQVWPHHIQPELKLKCKWWRKIFGEEIRSQRLERFNRPKSFFFSMKTFSGKKYFGIFSITFLITWRSGSALNWWNRRTLVQISPGFCTSSLILIWKLLSNLAPIRIKEIAPNSPWPTRVYEKISSSCGAIDYMIQLEFWDRAFIGVVSIKWGWSNWDNLPDGPNSFLGTPLSNADIGTYMPATLGVLRRPLILLASCTNVLNYGVCLLGYC